MANGAEREFELFEPEDRSEWRAWLARHHASTVGVFLVYRKKAAGRGNLSYDDAVEEALCFGWIDSRVNTIDATRYRQVFTRRKPKSAWSKLNKQRLEVLIPAGLMHEAGLKAIDRAKRDGSWELLDASEDLVMPDDLAAALDKDKIARTNYDAFTDGRKKSVLRAVYGAKRPETRAARVKEVVALVRAGFSTKYDLQEAEAKATKSAVQKKTAKDVKAKRG